LTKGDPVQFAFKKFKEMYPLHLWVVNNII